MIKSSKSFPFQGSVEGDSRRSSQGKRAESPREKYARLYGYTTRATGTTVATTAPERTGDSEPGSPTETKPAHTDPPQTEEV